MGKSKTGSASIKGFGLEDIPFLVFGILFAPSLGSFYFTLGERIVQYFYGKERKKNPKWTKWNHILSRPSHCIGCESPIEILSLLPILGYFYTKRKCPHCGSSIHWIYPISELLFLLIFLGNFYLTRNFLFSLSFLFLIGHVLVSMITDYKKMILDYENLFFLVPLGLLSNYLYDRNLPNLENLYVGLGFFGFYLGLFLWKPESIGFGDVLYAPFYAFLLGHPFWMFFLNSSYVLAVLNYSILKLQGKDPSPKIPMGYFLGFGFFFSYIGKILFDSFKDQGSFF